jgi:multimeric flavodoxin WrbA
LDFLFFFIYNLKDADGYIIGTPNYLSAPSGHIKVFYDEMFQKNAIEGKPVFCIVSHGGSGDIPELIRNSWSYYCS